MIDVEDGLPCDELGAAAAAAESDVAGTAAGSEVTAGAELAAGSADVAGAELAAGAAAVDVCATAVVAGLHPRRCTAAPKASEARRGRKRLVRSMP